MLMQNKLQKGCIDKLRNINVWRLRELPENLGENSPYLLGADCPNMTGRPQNRSIWLKKKIARSHMVFLICFAVQKMLALAMRSVHLNREKCLFCMNARLIRKLRSALWSIGRGESRVEGDELGDSEVDSKSE